MKSKLLKIAFVVAIVVVSVFNVYNALNADDLSDLALANVEALANDEYSKPQWNRYDYTLDNGTAAHNCWKGGTSSC